ncbi:hypothetical protein pEaSNUABM28_00222 [Erwinia phage pEa_SNUABM_28]|nr:hypothetical protein pEaSNUABM28_00222 [Erwinia phage pEa_SNUABM_28]
MTAIVKHISVHPKFKYARRVGIFDELDRREAEAKKKQSAPRSGYSSASSRFLYVDKLTPYTHSPFTPTPEK